MLIEPSAALVGAAYFLSESLLSLRRRAAKHLSKGDQGSLPAIWAMGFVAISVAFFIASFHGFGDLPGLRHAPAIGIAVFCLGTGVRWYSIRHLGRFFTVNVAITENHQLIETGPYRWVRHPSYTGWLTAITGLGLCLGNWVSLVILLASTASMILWRISIEERVLRAAFGEAYAAYALKTWRLIPFVY